MKLRLIATAALAAAATFSISPPASAQPYLGEMRLFGTTFCPRDWAHADGQLLSIGSNSALFSLIGTTYGGNGTTSFGLPDLRYRVPLGRGQGPGLSNYAWGALNSSHTHVLTVAEMPPHTHTVIGSDSPANTNDPAGAHFTSQGTNNGYGYISDGSFHPNAVSNAGHPSPTSFNIQQPTLQMRWCIAVNGVYPPRN